MPISLSDIKIQFQNTLHIMGKMLNNHALLPKSLVHFVLLLYTGRLKCEPAGLMWARPNLLLSAAPVHYYGTSVPSTSFFHLLHGALVLQR